MAATTSLDVCSVGELRAEVQAEALGMQATLVKKEHMLAALAEACLNYVRDDTPSPYTYPSPPSYLDLNPHRLSEMFIRQFSTALDLNATCVHDLKDRIGWVSYSAAVAANCTMAASDTLTWRCAYKYPGCPQTSATLSHPITVHQWQSQNNSTFCPIYCLQPGRYNNSFSNFLQDFTKPMELLTPSFLKQDPGILAMYFTASAFDMFRYAPSLYPSDFKASYNDDSVADIPLTYLVLARHPGDLTKVGYVAPYQDSITLKPCTSAYLPMVYGDDLIGLMWIDETFDDISVRLPMFLPTRGSLSFVSSLSQSALVYASSPKLFDLLYCPVSPDCSGDHWNATLFQERASGIFTETSFVHGCNSDTIGMWATVSGSAGNSTSTAMVTLKSTQYYAITSMISSDIMLTSLVPVTDIERAAIWSTTLSQDVFFVDASTSALSNLTLTISNGGLLSAPWAIKVDDPFAVAEPSNGFLPAGRSTFVQFGIRPSLAFNASTSWAKLTLSGQDIGSGPCFPTITLKVQVTYASVSNQGYHVYCATHASDPVCIAYYDAKYISSGTKDVFAAIGILALLMQLYAVGGLLKRRRTRRVFFGSLPLTFLSLLGTIAFAVELVLLSRDQTVGVCAARVLLSASGLSLITVPCLVKLYRFVMIFTTTKVVVIRDRPLVLLTVAFTALNIALAGAWIAQAGFHDNDQYTCAIAAGSPFTVVMAVVNVVTFLTGIYLVIRLASIGPNFHLYAIFAPVVSSSTQSFQVVAAVLVIGAILFFAMRNVILGSTYLILQGVAAAALSIIPFGLIVVPQLALPDIDDASGTQSRLITVTRKVNTVSDDVAAADAVLPSDELVRAQAALEEATAGLNRQKDAVDRLTKTYVRLQAEQIYKKSRAR
ncbi:G-protein coupled receptors family 3 profile domain-containing protein [Plasmodiophora brassicae]|uniref:G-protein coupled receptors family 3 profile domain-containing protein n=1 Tax=Plasmodiophora brassicae TaxID=37360 RepID=A0A3P3YLK1_PLABS|nr:unnamed protein product [Plasmodiophora brassicae]